MDKDKEHLTKEQLQQLIESDRNARIARATQRIREVLDEEQCQLIAQPQFTQDGRVIAPVQIVVL